MSMVELTLGYPPTVNTYYRNVNGRMLLSKVGRLYKMQAAEIAALEGVLNLGYEGAVEVWIGAIAPDKRKRDLDNILKPIMDCLQYTGIIIDDSQVVCIHAYKISADKENPGVHICIDPANREEAKAVADTSTGGDDRGGSDLG